MLKAINQQRGESTIFIFCILLILTSSLILWGYRKTNSFLNRRYFYKQTICFKTYLNQSREYIKRVDKINWAIQNIKKVSLVLKFIPLPSNLITNLATTTGTNAAIKYLIGMQNILHLNYLKDLTKLKLNSCHFEYSVFKTPYKNNGVLLSRDNNKMAIIRNSFKGSFSKMNFKYRFSLNKKAKGYFDVKFTKQQRR